MSLKAVEHTAEFFSFGGTFLVLDADPTHSVQALVMSGIVSLGVRIIFKTAEKLIDRFFAKKKKDAIPNESK